MRAAAATLRRYLQNKAAANLTHGRVGAHHARSPKTARRVSRAEGMHGWLPERPPGCAACVATQRARQSMDVRQRWQAQDRRGHATW